MSDLEKQVKITSQAHETLSRAKIELFGAESVRFSEVIETLAEQVIEKESDDE